MKNTVVEIIFPSTRRKKRLVILGILIVLIILGGYASFAYYQQTHQPINVAVASPSPTPTLTPPTPTPIPTPALVPSLLNGVLVPSGQENIHPLAVMIENYPDARPQSGLGQADLVYEAIAEGGITRFMAIYANPNQPIRVGPIRSARTYFVDFASEFNAFFAHVGGNIDALDEIPHTTLLDLDQFNVGAPVYNRDFSRPVAIEHTMYSSTDKLWQYAIQKKQGTPTTSFQPWLFQDDIPASERPASQTVKVSVSSAPYDVVWNYDPSTNSYLRTMAGSPHIDNNTGKQISAKTIILETVQRQEIRTRINEDGWVYTLTGTGPSVVIENGTSIKGTWKKEGTGRTRYYDTSGKEIALNRGTIWVHIVHPDSTLSY